MLSAYESKFYFMILYMIPNEMMSDFYMLSSRMMNKVLTKLMTLVLSQWIEILSNEDP